MAGAYMVHSTHAHTQAMAASMAGQGPGQNGTGGGRPRFDPAPVEMKVLSAKPIMYIFLHDLPVTNR